MPFYLAFVSYVNCGHMDREELVIPGKILGIEEGIVLYMPADGK